MKYYIIAGEASGDFHAAALIKEMKKADKKAVFRAWGGDKVVKEGAKLVKHYRETAFMGFFTVMMNIRTVLKNIRFCKKDVLQWQPDVVVLVDYPGFNLKIAKFAKKNGINVFYYISPKVWAWKKSRIKNIKRYVDKMYTILPFEKDFYKNYDYDVNYTGNPLVDATEKAISEKENFKKFVEKNQLLGKPVISLLPGSRKQEIKSMLPIMVAAANQFPNYEFVISGAPGMEKEFYHRFVSADFPVLFNQTYALVMHSVASVVASGTATLETALLNTPQVVCYKAVGGKFGYYFGKWLIDLNYISLVNLIMDKKVVEELIMHFFTPESLTTELRKILTDDIYRSNMLSDYTAIKKKLGKKGAAHRAAHLMIKDLKTIL